SARSKRCFRRVCGKDVWHIACATSKARFRPSAGAKSKPRRWPPTPQAHRCWRVWLKEEFVKRFERELPSATACFLDDFEACIAHLRLPIAHRKVIRTTNLLERLFGEERRRTKVIPHAFGERPVLKLMYAALIRASQT